MGKREREAALFIGHKSTLNNDGDDDCIADAAVATAYIVTHRHRITHYEKRLLSVRSDSEHPIAQRFETTVKQKPDGHDIHAKQRYTQTLTQPYNTYTLHT